MKERFYGLVFTGYYNIPSFSVCPDRCEVTVVTQTVTVSLQILVFSKSMIQLPLNLLPVKLPTLLEHFIGFGSSGILVRVDWQMVTLWCVVGIPHHTPQMDGTHLDQGRTDVCTYVKVKRRNVQFFTILKQTILLLLYQHYVIFCIYIIFTETCNIMHFGYHNICIFDVVCTVHHLTIYTGCFTTLGHNCRR